MNERTHFFIKIYLSHFILERVDVSCVWEVSWRRGLIVTYWPQVPLTITALLSHSGRAAQPWVTDGTSPLSGVGSHSASILSSTGSNSNWNWNWPKPSVAPGYIIVLRTPASTVIYTGASLDWRLGRGSIFNKTRNLISRTRNWNYPHKICWDIPSLRGEPLSSSTGLEGVGSRRHNPPDRTEVT